MAIYIDGTEYPDAGGMGGGMAGPGGQGDGTVGQGPGIQGGAPVDWFTANAPPETAPVAQPETAPVAGPPQVDPRGIFADPAPFGEQYTTPGRPEWLGQYTPMQWQGGDFAAPSMQEVMAEPGYQTRLNTGQQALERSAAARGSILSGGTQKATARYGQEFGANEYANVFGRKYQTYQQKYGQFQDAQAADMGARGINEAAYQGDVNNAQNQYAQRYRGYLDLLNNTQANRRDYWGAENDIANRGLPVY